ncbi:MAG TPA: type II secretion system protein GspN [Nitrospiraceae bacterium]|nr:type II secretion system protein GspN [Nitrospiraceae bacterium]
MMTWPWAWPETLTLKGPLGWVLASLACFIVFLFLTFPYGPLQNRLLTELNRATGWEVRAADWSVGFPVGIEWHDVVLAGPAIGAIPIEGVRATIGVFQAIVGQLVLDYAVQLPGGTRGGTGRATGSLTTASWSLHGPVAVKGHLQQMDLATVLKPYVTSGTIQGDFTHRWDSAQGSNAALKGEGTVKLEIKDLVIDRIPSGNQSMPSLTLGRIQASLVCRDAACDVTELKGDGVDGSFSVQGHVTLQQSLQQSLLDLTVTVVPGAGFAQKAASFSLPPFQPGTQLTFKLVGPIMKARVAL